VQRKPTASTLAQTPGWAQSTAGPVASCSRRRKQEEDGPYLAAKGHQFGVQASRSVTQRLVRKPAQP
jgi:hypothetical protein